MSAETGSDRDLPELHDDDPLARRLRALDLRLPAHGEHLEDERLAELATGTPATEAEAAHLAGCDECTGLWVALAADLEALSTDTAEAARLLTPPRPRGRRGPPPRLATWALLALAGVAAAAALWLEPWRVAPTEPAPPPPPAVQAPISAAAPPSRPDRPEEARPSPPAAPDDSTRSAAEPASTAQALTPTGPDPLPPTGPDPLALTGPEASVARAPGASPPAIVGTAPDPSRARIPASRPAESSAEVVRRPRTSARARPAATPAEAPPGLASASEARPTLRLPVDGRPRGYGFLRVNARPPARVYIDDKARGWTPLLDVRLAEGPHDVRLVYESPLAAQPEERFRVVIEPDSIWRTVRDNRKPGSPRPEP